jgi:hypothetical protein
MNSAKYNATFGNLAREYCQVLPPITVQNQHEATLLVLQAKS